MKHDLFPTNRFVRFVVLLSTFLLPSLAALAQTPTPQPANGVLWEIKSATNTAYLFGSLHIAKADFYPLPATVEAAYQQADTLAVEADATDTAAIEKALPLLTYAAPDKLEKHLSKQTWGSLTSTTGPAAEHLQTFRPVMLVMALTMQVFSQLGYDPQYGIDLHFINRAKTDRKKVVELESMEFQARILGSLSDADGDAMVAEMLRGLRGGAIQREAEALVGAWRSGDIPALTEIMRKAADKDAGSRKIMKMLMEDRNAGMAQKIKRMLETGDKAFVVVGAGHLVGANSIADLLQKQGLQVRQIK